MALCPHSYRVTFPSNSGQPVWYIAALACALVFCAPGCHLIVPNVVHIPQVHNPFPQLSRVAIAPFFNQSDEATLDGRQFSMAYFSQLQAVPGFEVVPLGVVEQAIVRHAVDLSSPGEARRLAQILGVDAVVIGSVTDFDPYLPPRCGMRVEWYTANSGFHEIPAGYGLPWGTPEEEFIPPELAYEAEMALARAQLANQTPDCTAGEELLPVPPRTIDETELLPTPSGDQVLDTVAYENPIIPDTTVSIDSNSLPGAIGIGSPFTPDLPIESGCIPMPPCAGRPPCNVHYGPVMTHTRIYHSKDPAFTEALSSYIRLRDHERVGNWYAYLQRSDNFIRFCCHMHISEMLSARGGAGETRVVCEWPSSR